MFRAMPRGGKREGAGRKKGSRNRQDMARAHETAASAGAGYTPPALPPAWIEALRKAYASAGVATIARRDDVSTKDALAAKLRMAAICAPFYASRMPTAPTDDGRRLHAIPAFDLPPDRAEDDPDDAPHNPGYSTVNK